jgi:hypothetical protein
MVPGRGIIEQRSEFKYMGRSVCNRGKAVNVFEDLRGASDIHIHPGPEFGEPRRVSAIEAAAQARDVGMEAVMYKPMSFPTMDKAYFAMKEVQGIKVFGGIMLDWCVGGINPKAVKVAVEQWHAKCVYFPLFSSANILRKSAGQALYELRLKQLGVEPGTKGATILGGSGEVIPEVDEIIGIVAENKGTVIDTAHLSPEESIVLIEEARKAGVEYVTVSHPLLPITEATVEQQKEMVRRGGYIVHTGMQVVKPNGLDPKKVLESIRAVGAEHTIMASDGGVLDSPTPVEIFRLFVLHMKRLGITDAEIDLMIRKNPRKILGLP